MADKLRRNPKDRLIHNDRRIRLAPLDFEQALAGLLKAGPHPLEKEPKGGTSKKRGHKPKSSDLPPD